MSFDVTHGHNPFRPENNLSFSHSLPPQIIEFGRFFITQKISDICKKHHFEQRKDRGAGT